MDFSNWPYWPSEFSSIHTIAGNAPILPQMPRLVKWIARLMDQQWLLPTNPMQIYSSWLLRMAETIDATIVKSFIVTFLNSITVYQLTEKLAPITRPFSAKMITMKISFTLFNWWYHYYSTINGWRYEKPPIQDNVPTPNPKPQTLCRTKNATATFWTGNFFLFYFVFSVRSLFLFEWSNKLQPCTV